MLMLLLASVAEQAGLSLTWSHISEGMFSHEVAHLEKECVLSNISIVNFFKGVTGKI